MPDRRKWPSFPPDDPRWIEELRQRTHDARELQATLQLQVLALQKQNESLERRVESLRRRLREKDQEVTQLICHTVVTLALIVAAVVLGVSGQDASVAWGALVAYGVGAGAQAVTSKRDTTRKTVRA